MPVDDAVPPTLPTEILDLIVEFALLSGHCDDAASSDVFVLIAPLTLASSVLRLLTLRRFLRHIIFSRVEFKPQHSQWNGFFKLLESLVDRTGGESFTWVKSIRASSKTLMGRYHSARLAALTHLDELSIDLATEGLITQKPFLKLIDSASPRLTMLTLTSLPCIDMQLLKFIAATFPCLLDLYLSCTERLHFHCWSCYEESLGRTTHSPIPDVFSSATHMAAVFAKILKPLAHLMHLHLGVYLSDEMLIQYHIDHAETEELRPFGPELCTLCAIASTDVQMRELEAGLEFAQSLKALQTVGFSSFFDDTPAYRSIIRKATATAISDNKATVYILRGNGRIKVKKSPWSRTA
ncbi:deacetylase sirtuin-type domain-containing protein [Favolaschia claudopus]|uniref:Deacetylase sirtuin-type domain-containing protein n=1 Tax=Favolaschia claudopus TaxID=2862362 RepID=A0AAW0AHF9_9AGAR